MKIRTMMTMKKAVLYFCMAVLFTTGIAVTAKAADYTYQSDSNIYLITQSSGNVTKAVNDAVKDAQGNAAAPAVVKLQPGTYEVGTINIKTSNVTLDVTGTTLKSTGGNMITISGENITIKGGTWQSAGSQRVFSITGSRNLVLDGCDVSGASDTNVRIDGGSVLSLQNVNIHDGKNYGLLAIGCTDVKLQSCKGDDNNYGLAFRATGAVLTDCQVKGNQTDGLQVKDKGANVTVIGGSYCENGKNGISMTSGAQMTLTGADISDNHSNGISPVGKKGTSTVLTAQNTTFNRNGRHGVAADTYVTVNISDCTANNNKANGIGLNKYCKSAGLINITANGNGSSKDANSGAGIMIHLSSTCDKIVNCTCNNNKKLGISLGDVTTAITGCSMNKNAKHGLHITGEKNNKVTVKDCTITDNKNNGIMAASNNETVNVTGNTVIRRNGNCGIEANTSIIKVTGKGNVVSDNKKHGIVSRNGKLMVSGATVENNKNYGVGFVGCKSGSYCTNSTIRNNQVGVNLSDGSVVNKVSGNVLKSNSKYNLMLYNGSGKKTTTLKTCAKNQFSVKKQTGYQIYFETNTKVPAKLKVTKGNAKKDKYGNTFVVAKK